MAQNKVIIQKEGDKNISISEINRNIKIADEKVKVVSVATQGPPGIGAETFIFRQDSNSDEWTIVHNLNKYPAVAVVDSGNNVIYTEVEYTDLNNLVVRFNGATSGKAYLN